MLHHLMTHRPEWITILICLFLLRYLLRLGADQKAWTNRFKPGGNRRGVTHYRYY